jgi:hypothetical protein
MGVEIIPYTRPLLSVGNKLELIMNSIRNIFFFVNKIIIVHAISPLPLVIISFLNKLQILINFSRYLLGISHLIVHFWIFFNDNVKDGHLVGFWWDFFWIFGHYLQFKFFKRSLRTWNFENCPKIHQRTLKKISQLFLKIQEKFLL